MNRRYAVSIMIALLWMPVLARGQNPPLQHPNPQSQQAGLTKSVEETNDAFVQKIMKQIEGHEQEPAEKVFKNVQIMKTAPAARFLTIMNLGYSRALGVTCTHCHVEQDFSSDDKRSKRAAREMAVMHRAINEQLAKMENLDPKSPGALHQLLNVSSGSGRSAQVGTLGFDGISFALAVARTNPKE